MTDQEIIEIIEEGIVDGTDMDCTPADQARAVLKALRDAVVFKAEWERGRDAAAAIAEECERQNGPLSSKGFPEQYRRGLEAGAQAIKSAILALNWEPPQ